MTAITVDNLSVHAGAKKLLGPVSFEITAGQTLVIMGETGAGKSLIAQAILGTLPQDLTATGRISVAGKRVDDLPQTDRARAWGRDLASLPQEPWRALDPLMPAFAQVVETHVHVAGRSRRNARDASERDLSGLGLAPREPRLPGALSGGMAQRVAFAAATAGGAPILLADEPTKGLDEDRQAHVVGLLADVPQKGGTLIVITHDTAVARALGGDLIVLRSGDVVEAGRTEAILTAPKAKYTSDLLAADPVNWPQTGNDHQHGDALLTASGLAIARSNQRLISGFDLTLHAAQRVAITGPSGIGKTTLLDTLGGLIPAAEGSVIRAPSLGRHDIQKLYQDPPAAFPPLVTLRTNLTDIARRHRADWDEVLTHLHALGLHPGLLNRRPDAVSGGELQRLSIARALIASPKVILADEPTSRLDPITQKQTLDLIASIAQERRIAVLLVTHSAQIARKWAGSLHELRMPDPHQKAA